MTRSSACCPTGLSLNICSQSQWQGCRHRLPVISRPTAAQVKYRLPERFQKPVGRASSRAGESLGYARLAGTLAPPIYWFAGPTDFADFACFARPKQPTPWPPSFPQRLNVAAIAPWPWRRIRCRENSSATAPAPAGPRPPCRGQGSLRRYRKAVPTGAARSPPPAAAAGNR